MRMRLAPWLAGLVLGFAGGCGDDSSGSGTEAGSGSSGGGDTEATETSGATGSGTGSGTESGSDTEGATFDPSSAIEQLVVARCEWLSSCCDVGEFGLRVGPFTADAADCSDRVLHALEAGSQTTPVEAGPSDLLVLLAYSYAAGRIELVEDAVMVCAESLRTASCTIPPPPPDDDEGEFCVPEESVVEDPCAVAGLVAGLLQEGEDCEPTLGVECAPGLVCQPLGLSGICRAESVDGDFCFSVEDCTAGLYCDFMTGTCTAASVLGEECAFENPENPAPGTETQRCEEGLACDPVGQTCVGPCDTGSPCTAEADCPQGHDCVLARCVQKKPAGDPCVVGAECETGFCQTGSCAALGAIGDDCVPHAQCTSGFCHPFSNTCQPQQSDGQPCTSFSDVECDDGVCDNSDPLNPVCVGFVGEGGACLNSQECSADQELQCIDSICQPTPLPNGATCFNGTQCVSGLCFEGVCDEPSAPGDPCTTVFDPMIKPCSTAAFCDVAPGETDGTCAAKRGAGGECTEDQQCWGTCQLNWGRLLCDDTPAEGEALCDGA